MSAVEFVAIGTSFGGIKALQRLFHFFPPELAVPVGIVIHRQASKPDYLTEVLQRHVEIEVKEAVDKAVIAAPAITIAPADYHMLIDTDHFALSVDPLVHFARPSIDVFFESVASEFGGAALGVILTGGGSDGVQGATATHNRGGRVLVQDPNSAEAADLPLAVESAGFVERCHTLDEIGALIAAL